MTFRTKSFLVLLLSAGLLVSSGLGTMVRAAGVGETFPIVHVEEFVSLMTKHSAGVKSASMTAEGKLDKLGNAPEASLGATSQFVSDQFELAKASPESVKMIDQAHTTVGDDLVLCLEMKKTGEKSKLAFESVEFCQGVGTNLLHRLKLFDGNGTVLATYTLDSYKVSS